jgi:hypothetical protein
MARTKLAEPGTGKDCAICKEHLTLDSFARHSHTTDRLQSRCRVCHQAGRGQYVQSGEPLKVRIYTPTLINGSWINVPGEKVTGQ